MENYKFEDEVIKLKLIRWADAKLYKHPNISFDEVVQSLMLKLLRKVKVDPDKLEDYELILKNHIDPYYQGRISYQKSKV
ncbi:MAG: hypothetical protein EOP04_00495 [Proteobacteria bacterium]|nr:MAG: hypothetical protein EOP04_00495 [Pseudomonadota bacterium]